MRYFKPFGITLASSLVCLFGIPFIALVAYLNQSSIGILIFCALFILLLVHTFLINTIYLVVPSLSPWIEVTQDRITIGRGSKIKRVFTTSELQYIHKEQLSDSKRFVFACRDQKNFNLDAAFVSADAEEAIDALFPIRRDVETLNQ